MKKSSQILSGTTAILFFIVTMSFIGLAAERQPAASQTTGIKAIQPPVANLEVCKDPAVSNFNVTKTLANNVATFTMTGQVCNNGPGDYNQPDNPLEAHFNVYAAYGPMFSYAAAGDTKFYTKPIGSVLKKSQCMTFTQTYTRDKVLHWGFPSPAAAPKPNEKPMKLLFEFFVRDAKGLLGTSSQPKSLDCNTSNNLQSQTYEMTISTP
ncbi:MAG TPA: hypothetical protein PLT45_02805 [Smithella sp.]|nr:hypothetical protein [Smithella sp.]